MIQFYPDDFKKFFDKLGYNVHLQDAVRMGWMGAVNSLSERRDEVLASALHRSKQLERDLHVERTSRESEVKHWKGNHRNLRKAMRLLRDRPDLPTDRLPVFQDYRRVLKQVEDLQKENAELKEFISTIQGE